jgi:hypothetical protein
MTTSIKWQPKDPRVAFSPVEMRPLYMPTSDGLDRYKELARHFAVVDVEQEAAFSVVTDDYQLVTNEEAYKKADEVMRKVFHTTKAEDMECLNITMPKTRSFCHIDLIHKSTDFRPWEDDKWVAFLRISNSYNRTRLLRFELGFCRWICMNGMIFGSKSVEFSYAHTRRGMNRVERFEDNIGDIRKIEATFTESLHQLKRYYVPPKEMLPIVCKAFDIVATSEDMKKARRVESLTAIRDQVKGLTESYFTGLGPHGYAALNVLTDYATRPSGVIAPEASMHGLQQKASNWMENFVSAIKKSDFSFDTYLAEYRSSAELIESL